MSNTEEVGKWQYLSKDRADHYVTYQMGRGLQERYVQIPSIRKLLGGSLKGMRVLDLACGNGSSTRILADLEPDELVGVDLSDEQIQLAKKFSANDPKYTNIEYLVRDCSKPLGLGQFDLVFSKHLLNYCNSSELLNGMVSSMFDATKPGCLSNSSLIDIYLCIAKIKFKFWKVKIKKFFDFRFYFSNTVQ